MTGAATGGFTPISKTQSTGLAVYDGFRYVASYGGTVGKYNLDVGAGTKLDRDGTKLDRETEQNWNP